MEIANFIMTNHPSVGYLMMMTLILTACAVIVAVVTLNAEIQMYMKCGNL